MKNCEMITLMNCVYVKEYPYNKEEDDKLKSRFMTGGFIIAIVCGIIGGHFQIDTLVMIVLITVALVLYMIILTVRAGFCDASEFEDIN